MKVTDLLPPIPETACFDCGATLLPGPRGGLSVNMACAACKQEFNVAFWQGAAILVNRLGVLRSYRAASVYGLKAET